MVKEDLSKVGKFVKNLVLAEEDYLRAFDWKEDEEGLWTHAAYVARYTRNHAILVCKAADRNIGYW